MEKKCDRNRCLYVTIQKLKLIDQRIIVVGVKPKQMEEFLEKLENFLLEVASRSSFSFLFFLINQQKFQKSF